MRASAVSRPTFSARMTRPPEPLSVPPISFDPTDFIDGMDFPGHHGFVDCARAIDHFAVHGDLFARTHAQGVANRNLFERDLMVVAFGVDPQSALRREVEERADGVAGPFPRRQLQHLSDDHQHRDDGRRLEIDRRPRGRWGKSFGASVAKTL